VDGGGKKENATKLDYELCGLGDYIESYRMYKSVRTFYEGNIKVADGDRKTQTMSVDKFLEFIIERGKEGISIQRYKGLGEMNPEQLWSTTMDPERRSLIKVSIEDAVGADQIFTVLMGSNVETRRLFIEGNALNVRNLDI
jgi:DNA gyrase subunit B